MRSPLLALAAVMLLSSPALAGVRGGTGGGGRGPLGQTSSGLGRASNPPSPPSTPPPPTPPRPPSPPTPPEGYPDRVDTRGEHHTRCYDRRRKRIEVDCHHLDASVALYGAEAAPARPLLGGIATVDFYAGAQKVHDSDGSFSLEVAVRERRLRIGGTYSRYFETLDGGGQVTMAMPTLTGGVRVDDLGTTGVYFEGGVVYVSTDDPMGDSSLTGAIAGMRVEQRLGKRAGLVGDVHQLWLPDGIRARAARVGVHYNHIQASFRVLDFNVGPPLYGPEVGVRF